MGRCNEQWGGGGFKWWWESVEVWQGALRGGGDALQRDEEELNDDGKASKGNWEAFMAMQSR